MEIEKTVCFTGHRPEKLGGYVCEKNMSHFINIIKSMIYYRAYDAAESGYKYFISGVARGVDLWAADAVLDIKKKFPDIKLICAKPFPEHENSLKGKELWCFNNVIEKADDVICVSDRYHRNCYRKRNYYMVDNSSLLIGVVDNFKSGTGQTIEYARKKNLDISLIIVPEIAEASGLLKTF